MARIVLMANDMAGESVAAHLVACGDEIVRLYLPEPKHQKNADAIRRAARCNHVRTASALQAPQHPAGIRTLQPDWIITAYWAHLLKQPLIDAARIGTVNLHPALLPVNRGWYPYVHSILDGSPAGVTLHAITAKPDCGPIWVQRAVEVTTYDTAFTLRARLQDEIIDLFRESWSDIAAGRLVPQPQHESQATYHHRSEVAGFRRLNLDETMTVRQVINILRARSFGDVGYAYCEVDGKKAYLNIRLNTRSDMTEEKCGSRTTGVHEGG